MVTVALSVVVGSLVLTSLAFTFAPRAALETEVVLDADPERVWSVLTDGERFHEWNPFLRSMRGALVEGGRLENHMTPAGGSPMTFRPTVLEVVPARRLRWLGRLLVPRLFDGEHSFELQPLADGRTRLVHGERFRGVALWLVDVQKFRADFDAMNQALARRVLQGGLGGSPADPREGIRAR
ncbi:MAG: SRPBCC domain-containing protein [Myxococcota bacterium]